MDSKTCSFFLSLRNLFLNVLVKEHQNKGLFSRRESRNHTFEGIHRDLCKALFEEF